VTLQKQAISIVSDLTQCSNQVSGSCLVRFSGTVEGMAVGDVVWISGLLGNLADSQWTSTAVNGSTWYYHTLVSSDIAGSTVKISLTYIAPSYTTTANSLNSFQISRSNSTYASTSTSISLCSTTVLLSISSSSLAVTPLTTYSIATVTL